MAREFARNAEVTDGRSMICMGAGTNHWFHSDQTYRTFLALVMLVRLRGTQRWRLGALRRPGEGPPVHGLADGRVRARLEASAAPPVGTPFFYLATDQWRYDRIRPERLRLAVGPRPVRRAHIADINALGARLGWLPSYPSFDRNPLELVDDAEPPARPAAYVVRELRAGRLRFAGEDPTRRRTSRGC